VGYEDGDQKVTDWMHRSHRDLATDISSPRAIYPVNLPDLGRAAGGTKPFLSPKNCLLGGRVRDSSRKLVYDGRFMGFRGQGYVTTLRSVIGLLGTQYRVPWKVQPSLGGEVWLSIPICSKLYVVQELAIVECGVIETSDVIWRRA